MYQFFCRLHTTGPDRKMTLSSSLSFRQPLVKKQITRNAFRTGKAHFYNLSNLEAFVNIFIKKLPKNQGYDIITY